MTEPEPNLTTEKSAAPDFEWVNVSRCPVCDSPSEYHKPFSQIEDEGFQLQYMACRVCGLVFQSPRLSEESMASYYAQHYHQEKMPSADDASRNRWVQDQRGQYIVDWLQQHEIEVGCHLDIGASRGGIIEALRSEFSCESYGVEPGDDLRQELIDRELSAYADIGDLPAALQGDIDLITMSHTLEHLPEPREYIADLQRKWLRPEGLLLLEVPNLTWHSALEFSHLTAFSQESLRSLAGQAGYSVHDLVQHGRPYSGRLPLFLLAAFQPAESFEGDLPSAPSPWELRLRRLVGTSIYQFAQWVSSVRHSADARSPWRD